MGWSSENYPCRTVDWLVKPWQTMRIQNIINAKEHTILLFFGVFQPSICVVKNFEP